MTDSICKAEPKSCDTAASPTVERLVMCGCKSPNPYTPKGVAAPIIPLGWCQDCGAPINQCQGCQAGWPTEKHKPWPVGSKPMEFHLVEGGYKGEKVFCTKERYT